MDDAIQIAGFSFLVPGTVALASAELIRRFTTPRLSQQWGLSAALAMAFCAGYALLPSWAAWLPDRHWHWLPWLGAAAALLGPIGMTARATAPARLLPRLVLSILAASLLTPAWPDLQPSRPWCIALLAAYFAMLSTGLESLPERLLQLRFVLILRLPAIAVAVLLAASISLKFGQLGLIATAALIGCSFSRFFGEQGSGPRGLISAYTILVGGLAFVGSIETNPPRWELMLAPAAPLALWICTWGPISRLSGRAFAAARLTVVLVPLVALAIWVLFDRTLVSGS